MNKHLIGFLLAVFSSYPATAQTPGVDIAPPFAVIDGQPNEIGAYYRKVITPASSTSLGIHSRGGTIPEFAADANRFFIQDLDGVAGYSLSEMNDYRTGSRDRPSIYLGGRCNNVEIDAGLAWNRVWAIVGGVTRATWTGDADGSSRTDQYYIESSGGLYRVKNLQGTQITSGSVFAPSAAGAVTIGTKTLYPNYALRPFFRSSDHAANSGYHTIATAGGTNDSRFYAADLFTIELKKLQTGEIRLIISGGPGGVGEATTYTTTVAGFSSGSPTFKRVDSIDQKGREGLTTEPTNATVVRGGWGITSVLKSTANTPLADTAGLTVKPVEFSQNTYNYLFGSIGQGRATRVDGSEPIYINPPNP
ncbi:MAG: hypothetical protein JSS81_09775 [Acidobacteria bacterium]|nr:hypothetical protein [Acidobacteriota bacterium]